MNDLDTYRCAKLLLDQHGAGAAIHAAMRANELPNGANRDAGHRACDR